MTAPFPRHPADHLALGLVALTGGLTALVYRSLPAQIATHFDWHGTANSWQPRALAAVLLPAVALGLLLLLRLVPRRGGATPWLAAATVAFVCTLHVLLLGHARVPDFDVVNGVTLACGLFFTVLGLLMPKMKQNPWVGARTYWTLRSPEVWARTQRVTGAVFFYGGLLVVAVSWLRPSLALGALLSTAVVATVLSFLYSWRAATRA